MNTIVWLRNAFLGIVLVLAGVIIASPMFTGHATAQQPAAPLALGQEKSMLVASQAAQLQQMPASASSSTATWTTCTPQAVAVFAERVHVRCVESVGGIVYFAAPTSNNSHAARILSVLTAAHASGGTLQILYDPADTSGADIGCNANDCRLILGVENF